MWNKPCAECLHCIPIGDGEGLCDYPYKIKSKKIVNLFDIEPNCPYKKKNKCPHQKTVAINEEGHAGVYCADCGEQLEKEC